MKNSESKENLKTLLNEVKFKIDVLNHDYTFFKKFEKGINTIKKYFKDNGINFERGIGFSISSSQTSSFSDGESKKKVSLGARLKLDQFDQKVKDANKSIKDVKKYIEDIFIENGLEVIEIKYKESNPEELVYTIKF